MGPTERSQACAVLPMLLPTSSSLVSRAATTFILTSCSVSLLSLLATVLCTTCDDLVDAGGILDTK